MVDRKVWKQEIKQEIRRTKGCNMENSTTNDKISSLFGVTLEEFLKLTDKEQNQAIEFLSRRFGIGNKAFAKDFGISREEFAKKVWDRLKLGRLSGGCQTQAQATAYQRFQSTGVGALQIKVGKKPVPWIEVTDEKVCVSPLTKDDLPQAQSASNPSSALAKTWVDLAMGDEECFYAHFDKLYARFVDTGVVTPERIAQVLRVPVVNRIKKTLPKMLKEHGFPRHHKALDKDSEDYLECLAEFEQVAMAIENRNAEQRAKFDAMMPVNALSFLKMSDAERAFFIGMARVLYPAPTYAYGRALGLYAIVDTSVKTELHDSIHATQVYAVTDYQLCQKYAAHLFIKYEHVTEATLEFLEKLKIATNNMTDEELVEAKQLAKATFGTEQRMGPDVQDVVVEKASSALPASLFGDDKCKQIMYDMFTPEKLFGMLTPEEQQTVLHRLFTEQLTDQEKDALFFKWLAANPEKKEEVAFAQFSEQARGGMF